MDSIGDLRTKLAALEVERDDLRRQVMDLRRTVDLATRLRDREVDHLRERLFDRDHDFLTIHEFASLARMTRRNLDRYRRRPDFPAVRVIGRRHLYSRTEVMDWIMRQTV